MKPKIDENGVMTAEFSASDVRLWQAMRKSLTNLRIIEQCTQMGAEAYLLRRGLEHIMAERIPGMEALVAQPPEVEDDTEPEPEPDAD